MNNLKFRAWDGLDYMSTPFTIYDVQAKNIELAYEAIIMQFTGLKDKNGKEIYENDIVGIDKDGFVGYLEYEIQGAQYLIRNKELKHVREILPQAAFCDGEDYILTGVEIIGNIFESPDLLK